MGPLHYQFEEFKKAFLSIFVVFEFPQSTFPPKHHVRTVFTHHCCISNALLMQLRLVEFVTERGIARCLSKVIFVSALGGG
jgi:hypothetical protein